MDYLSSSLEDIRIFTELCTGKKVVFSSLTQSTFDGYNWRNKENFGYIIKFFKTYVDYKGEESITEIKDFQNNFEDNPHGGKEFLQALEELKIIDEKTKFAGIPYKRYNKPNKKESENNQHNKESNNIRNASHSNVEVKKVEDHKNLNKKTDPKNKKHKKDTKHKPTETTKKIYKNPLFVGSALIICSIFTYLYLQKYHPNLLPFKTN
jgi:Fe2+ transport system protein B